MVMKAEYDLSTMTRKGHPLSRKVARGEIKLINPLDIPDVEIKLAKLSAEERVVVTNLLDSYRAMTKS